MKIALRQQVVYVLAAFLLVLIAALGSSAQADTRAGRTVPLSPRDIRPLMIGDTIPNAIVASVDGKPVALQSLTQDKPTILLFYRGGW